MKTDLFVSNGDLLGIAVIKFYKSLDNNTTSNLQKLMDDFTMLIDIPFYSMSLKDNNKVMLGELEVAILDIDALYMNERRTAISELISKYNSKYYKTFYIRCNNWVIGKIDFYNDKAFEVFKGWVEDARAKHDN